MKDKIKNTVVYIVNLIVNCNYDEIVRLTNGVRLQSEHIKDAINEYGKTIISPPDNAYEDLDIIEIENVSPQKWSVRFDLWTKEEGRSDLSIELTLINTNEDLLNIEFDNIHVL